jgi:hypothetical protein
MAREFFKPYKTPSNSAFLDLSEWVDEEDHPIIEEGILTKRWSPNSVLSLNRNISFNKEIFLEEAGLQKNDIIRFTNKCFSIGTGLKISETNTNNKNIRLNNKDKIISINSSINIDGTKISESINLISEIVLIEKNSLNDISAITAGSILWQDSIKISLEGSDPIFPIEQNIFPQSFFNTNWCLEIDHNLDSTITGGIKLLFNKDKKVFIENIRSDLKYRELLTCEIAKQIIIHCLLDDDFKCIESLDNNYSENSIGQAALNLISRIKNFAPNKLYNLYKDNPLEFDKLIQHYFISN